MAAGSDRPRRRGGSTEALRMRADGVADVLLLGIAVTIGLLGLVTAFIVLLAAAEAGDPADDDERPVLRRFREAARRHRRQAVMLQLLWLLLPTVGLMDLWGAALMPLALRPGVTGVGVVLLVAAAVLPPFLAVAAVQQRRRAAGPADPPVRAVITVAGLAAAGRPLRALAVLLLTAAGVTSVVTVAVLLPLLGVVALAALRTAAPAVRLLPGRDPGVSTPNAAASVGLS